MEIDERTGRVFWEIFELGCDVDEELQAQRQQQQREWHLTGLCDNLVRKSCCFNFTLRLSKIT